MDAKHTGTSAQGRLDPFTTPPGNGRYLRNPAVQTGTNERPLSAHGLNRSRGRGGERAERARK